MHVTNEINKSVAEGFYICPFGGLFGFRASRLGFMFGRYLMGFPNSGPGAGGRTKKGVARREVHAAVVDGPGA
jgi:hypothetical protein